MRIKDGRPLYLTLAPVVLAAPIIGLVSAAPAAAECENAGGATVCSQGDVRASGGSGSTSSGAYWPYPCDADWLCSDGGVDLILPAPPPRPNPPPDIGRPGRPGIGPR